MVACVRPARLQYRYLHPSVTPSQWAPIPKTKHLYRRYFFYVEFMVRIKLRRAGTGMDFVPGSENTLAMQVLHSSYERTTTSTNLYGWGRGRVADIWPNDVGDDGSAFNLPFCPFVFLYATIAPITGSCSHGCQVLSAPAESHWSLVSNTQTGLIVSVTNQSNYSCSNLPTNNDTVIQCRTTAKKRPL